MEYKGFSLIYSHFGCIGHRDNLCDKMKYSDKDVPDSDKGGNNVTKVTKECQFGYWMMVKNTKTFNNPHGRGREKIKHMNGKDVKNFHVLDEFMKKEVDSMIARDIESSLGIKLTWLARIILLKNL